MRHQVQRAGRAWRAWRGVVGGDPRQREAGGAWRHKLIRKRMQLFLNDHEARTSNKDLSRLKEVFLETPTRTKNLLWHSVSHLQPSGMPARHCAYRNHECHLQPSSMPARNDLLVRCHMSPLGGSMQQKSVMMAFHKASKPLSRSQSRTSSILGS